MNGRAFAPIPVLAVGIVVAWLSPVPIASQGPAPAATTAPAPPKDWKPPVTPWGEPDLQGMWDTRSSAPFERPAEFGNREFMTEEEQRNRRGFARVESDDDDDGGSSDADLASELAERDKRAVVEDDKADDYRPGRSLSVDGSAYNSFWNRDPTAPKASLRTSQIVDPPDGRMPPWTREALTTWEKREEARRGRSQGDHWIDRGGSERCIIRNGLPGEMSGGLKEIVQTPGHVGIVMLYGYVRMIPITNRPHLGPRIRQWNGDARGRWEGNTLVVETVNFKNTVKDNIVPAHGGPYGAGGGHVHYYAGTGETLRLTERFTRLDPRTIEYRYTVDDPQVWVRPWTAVTNWNLDSWTAKGKQDRQFEYACHEHNYGMVNALRGARADRKWALDEANREAAVRKRQLQAKWELLKKWESAKSH